MRKMNIDNIEDTFPVIFFNMQKYTHIYALGMRLKFLN